MPKKILIVEDEAELHKAYKMLLTAEKYTVLSAFDGQEALDLLEDEKVDLILLDIRMPRVSGIEFLRQFKNNQKTKIIVFSNLDAEKDIDTVYELGADRYILKAWASPQELVKVVKDNI